MVGDLLEAGRQPVGVLRPHRRERAKDDEIQSALQELDAVRSALLGMPSEMTVTMTRSRLGCQVERAGTTGPAPARHERRLTID